MFSVIDRYISRQIFQTLMGVTVVLLLIFISNRLVRYLAGAASGDIPSDLVFTLLGLKTVSFLVLLIPLALYLSILLVLGRMYRDNEMAAMSAGGIGFGKLYSIVFTIAIPTVIVLGWVSLSVVPTLAQIEYNIIRNAEKDLEVTGISAGRFREASGGERIVYVESVSKDSKTTHKVFIHARIHSRHVVFSAETARIQKNEIGERYLVLQDGYRYDGVPGQANYRMTRYKEHAFKLISKLRSGKRLQRDAVPTRQLWHSSKPHEMAELQWRISIPLLALFLGMLAIPIAKVKPREGRYGKLVVAIIYFVIYFSLLSVSRGWVGQGRLSPTIGLWWVHGAVFGVTMLLLARQLGLRYLFKPTDRRT